MKYWTNPSVLEFAGESDPTHQIALLAREKVLSAMQAGWQGPPFDPFKLAELLEIRTIPRDDVLDARIVLAGSKRLQIEYNPNRPRGRVRFSIAHEIAHALFPDCAQFVRNRGHSNAIRDDDWQLELLCNIAAAEFLMPVGTEIDSSSPLTIDNILNLQKIFDVSIEAICTRLIKITPEPCTVMATARASDIESINTYRLDYNIPSRTSTINLPTGLKIPGSILSQCTAVGYTAKGGHQTVGKFKNLNMECVGIPPYPSKNYPRVIAIVCGEKDKAVRSPNITYLFGDALEPRGMGIKIIAHIVNDKTPNWGAGFARAVQKKYPPVQKNFKDWAVTNMDKFTLGNTHIATISDELCVMNMIAQHGYGSSSKPRIRYTALKDCLKQLSEIALNMDATVHLPRIGTGYAGGNWNYILELIDEILIRKGIKVTIYTRPDYKPDEIQNTFSFKTGTESRHRN